MEPEKKSNGALVGSIIIIIILIAGGIYIWQTKVQKALEEKKFQEENVVPLDTNELNTLEEDLNTTDTTIDVDVNAIN
jgi:ABC-type Na+ efflux pump permease subunit